MMQLYRARLRPLSPVSTQLQSDALFGAFCWSFRYRYGADALEQLLAEMEQQKECHTHHTALSCILQFLNLINR